MKCFVFSILIATNHTQAFTDPTTKFCRLSPNTLTYIKILQKHDLRPDLQSEKTLHRGVVIEVL